MPEPCCWPRRLPWLIEGTLVGLAVRRRVPGAAAVDLGDLAALLANAVSLLFGLRRCSDRRSAALGVRRFFGLLLMKTITGE